jgi:hypothetical protein
MAADIPYSSQIADLLTIGDKLFVNDGTATISTEITARKDQLKKEKDTLNDEIRKSTAIIEKNNQDFYDVKQTVPDPYPAENKIHTIEDYTLGFLTISYVFMVSMLVYLYVLFAPNRWAAFGRGVMLSVLLTLFLVLLAYYFA